MTEPDLGLLATRARKATGLTQEGFATLIGCDRVTVANWETGRRPPSRLSASLLRLLAADPKLAVKTLREGHEELEGRLDTLHERVSRTKRDAKSVTRLTDREVAHSHKRTPKKKGGRS